MGVNIGSIVFGFLMTWPAAGAPTDGVPTADVLVALDAPLSGTFEVRIDAGELGRHLAQIDRGSSPLTAEDQRLLVESALAGLVRASLHGGWDATTPPTFGSIRPDLTATESRRLERLTGTLFKHFERDHLRDARDPILSVVVLDGFLLDYVGIKLVTLHERIGLGWRDHNAAWALPTLLQRGAERAVAHYLDHGHQRLLDDHVRMLAALRGAKELAPGPELRFGFAEFVGGFAKTIPQRLPEAFARRVRRPIDVFSIALSTTWLAALAVLSPVVAYGALTDRTPELLVAHPVAFVTNAALLTLFPTLLNIVARGRLRERRAGLEATVGRFEKDCENALFAP